MNNNQNNNDNIVKPVPVDLNNSNINHDDTILNRERDNIVSATIQANTAIDEEKALKVNDQIKIKKKNPILQALIIIILLMLAGFLSYLAFIFVKDVAHDEKPSTTTKTTQASALTKILNYLNDTERLRKFQSENTILVLSPKGYDLVNGYNYYLLINFDENGLKTSSYGNYTIQEDTLKLSTLNAGEVSYNVTEDGILLNGDILKIFDSEMKYYSSKNNEQSELLIINGTLKSEYAMYITSDGVNTNVLTSSYVENQDNITLATGLVFEKEGNTLKTQKSVLNITY